MFSLPIAIGMLLAAGAILVFFYLRSRARRAAALPSNPGLGQNEPRAVSGRVLWDIADGGREPAIRNGALSLDRRSFLSRATTSAFALVGLAAASAAAHAASASSGARADSFGSHTDSPHNDTTGHHTDITCDPPTCSESHHADTTSHNDRPHVDVTKD